jgi:hypothetical protein
MDEGEEENENAQDEKEEKDKIIRTESSCLVFTIITVLIALTAVVIYFRRNIPETFWLQSGQHAQLLGEFG